MMDAIVFRSFKFTVFQFVATVYTAGSGAVQELIERQGEVVVRVIEAEVSLIVEAVDREAREVIDPRPTVLVAFQPPPPLFVWTFHDFMVSWVSICAPAVGA